MSISSMDSDNGNSNGEYECECGHKYNHASGLSRHKKTCKYLKQKEELIKSQKEHNDLIKMMMTQQQQTNMMMMNMFNSQQQKAAPVVEAKKSKKDKPTFSIKEYLKKCKDVPQWKTFIRSKKYTVDEYDIIYNSGAIEGTKKIINQWLSNLDKKTLPFVITNEQKARFTIYCKEENEWKKYERETGYEKVLNFIETLSCRMLFGENSNVIYEKYPLAAPQYSNSYRNEAREQQQIRIVMLGTLANVADHTRKIAKDIISNFVVGDQEKDDEDSSDDEIDDDNSSDSD